MRDHRVRVLGLASCMVWLAACSGGDEGRAPKEPEEKPRAMAAAELKATAAAVIASPTAIPTPTEEPTPEVTPSPLPTAAPEGEESSAEELELLGIVRAGSAPSAVIAFEGQQEIFRKGDTVYDHGTIKEVGVDSVTIRSGEKDTVLTLAKPAAEPTEAAPAEDVVESRPPAPEPPPVDVSRPLSRAEVRAALRDLKAILAEADAKRVSVGGGRGLQLGKVERASFLAKLGLRSGDVLQKLDGFPIDDPERPPDLSSAAQGRELTIAFTRNDIGLTVTRSLE